MTLANEDTSGQPSTNEDVANKPRQTKMLQTNHDGLQERNIQHMETWEANHDGPRRVHQDDIFHKALQLQ